MVVFLQGEFQKYIWNYYDTTGKLEKSIDYAKPFLFFCKDNAINLYDDGMFNNMKLLTEKSTCMCSTGGKISIQQTGHTETHSVE
jgi:hypothetical protein